MRRVCLRGLRPEVVGYARTTECSRASIPGEPRVRSLPARFDDTKIPGIRETVGYIDLRTHTAEELTALIVTKIGPRERTNFLPDDLSRLFARLGIDDEADQQAATRHAQSFFHEFHDLDAKERELVVAVFSAGCPGEMPENMHLHLEKIRRWLKIEPDSIAGMVKRMSPFGFEYSLKSDPDEPGGRLRGHASGTLVD